MNISQLVALFTSILAVAIGVVIGLLGTKSLFRRKSYSPSNAIELLKLERAEEWNEVRILNPEWHPEMKGGLLRGLSLPGINFRDSNLENVVLADSILDDANFERAHLQNADFSRASLRDATFVGANLRGANFDRANITRAVFEGAQLADANIKGLDRTDHIYPHFETQRSLDDLSPRQFEELVADVFRRRGYEVTLTSQTRDAGYDLIARRSDPVLGEQTFLVEAKKYPADRKVGLSPLRALMGSVIGSDAERGIFVTTSSFTSDARALADKSGRLRLIDGPEFQLLMRTFGPDDMS
jgi:hypothetical protein